MTARSSIPLRRVGALAPPRPADQLVTACIAPDGRAVGLWAQPSAAAALAGHVPSRRDPRLTHTILDQPVQVRVTIQDRDAQPAEVTIDELNLVHPHLALLPDDEVLLVGARCAWTPEHVEPNAAIFSAQGQPLHRAVVGDGVEHVRTTKSGAIWIGYSDEGVYGNFGWATPGPSTIGGAGLLRFDSRLQLQWQFPQIEPRIDDLYAINIVDDAAWVCYYMDFPVARVHADSVTTWPTDMEDELLSVNHLLVDRGQSRVALINEANVVLGTLEQRAFAPARTIPLGLQPEHHAAIVTQGADLYVITKSGELLITDIATIAEQTI